MLISESKKLIFVHIQKTAGSSITQLIREQVPDTRIYMSPHDPIRHAHANFGEKFYNYHIRAGFVRNPFDRLVSWYTMISTQGKILNRWQKFIRPGYNRVWQYVLTHSNNFEEFLRNCTEARNPSGWKPFLYNQVDYLTDEKGELLVNFIGRFENIQEDSGKLLKTLGLEKTNIPHVNETTHQNYRKYYTPETRRLIESRFAKDLEYFSYEF